MGAHHLFPRPGGHQRGPLLAASEAARCLRREQGSSSIQTSGIMKASVCGRPAPTSPPRRVDGGVTDTGAGGRGEKTQGVQQVAALISGPPAPARSFSAVGGGDGERGGEVGGIL